MKRSIRVISLLLAVLLIALPPLQASAIGTGAAVLIGLGACAVVGSIMVGLGVMPGSDHSVFEGLVNDCIASEGVSKFLNPDGTISVLRYATLNGEKRIGTLKNLIQAVFSWIWDNKIISSYEPVSSINVTLGSNTYDKYSSNVPIFPLIVKGVYSSKVTYIVFVFSDSAGKLYLNGSFNKNLKNTNYSYGYYQSIASYETSLSSSLTYSGAPLLDIGNYPAIPSSYTPDFDWHFYAGPSSVYDLTLGNIAPSFSDISEAYPDWAAGAISVPHPGISIPGIDLPGVGEDDDDLVYVPTGIGDLVDIGSDASTGALTQEGVISGVGTLDDTLIDAIPGTRVDGITGDIATTVPGEGTEEGEGTVEGEGTGEGTITYPTEIGSYALDLTDFFPFCIPFDVVDFLTLLAAEPEAPHFEFDINFPYMDEPWHVVIDLSAWDNIAALLRTLELLAFIVGLAVVTREKFLRG